ncbi:hypothetical protein D3C85_1315030 [compost metagenome]
MKYLLYIVLSFGLLHACSKKEASKEEKWTKDSLEIAKLRNYIVEPANGTTIKWTDGVYKELDSVTADETVEVSWAFENTGSKSLVIANVSTSCNFTVVDKPKKQILPGEKGIIKAQFDTKGLQGWQRKDVYLLVNSKANLVQTLSFAVHVMK